MAESSVGSMPKIRQHLGEHVGNHGRGQQRAEEFFAGRLVDDDQDGDLRVLRRREGDAGADHPVVARLLALGLVDLLRGAGLGYDIIPVDRNIFCRIGQNLTKLIGGLLADGLPVLVIIGHICEVAVLVGIPLEQMRRDEIAAVGNRGQRAYVLQHGNLHILPEGGGRKVDGRQGFVVDAVAFAEHVAAGGLRIAKRIEIAQERLGAERLPDLDERGVAGLTSASEKSICPCGVEWQW